jgi:hypothetical protein
MSVVQSVVQTPSRPSKSSELIQQIQPRRSPRIASTMSVVQPVVTNSSVSNQPRRSPRLAAKRRVTILVHARHFLIPLFNQLEHTHGLNPRVHLILQIMNYLNYFPTILVWSPKMRNTISERMKHIWSQIQTNTIIDKNLKNDIGYCFIILQEKLVDIQSHPEYVA